MAIESPLRAAAAPDPYPYYCSLLTAERPLWDEANALWIVARAATVEEALRHPAARVRPTSAPVPPPIVGSAAGGVFGSLVRMNDGERQARLKRLIHTVLSSLTRATIEQRTADWANTLHDRCAVSTSAHGLRDFCYQLPVHVVGALLGVPAERLSSVADWTKDFVKCIAPGGSAEDIQDAKHAAERLQALYTALLADGSSADGLITALRRTAEKSGDVSEQEVVANAIGFMSQTFEATAGLLGNTLVCLQRVPALRTSVQRAPACLAQIVSEVVRFDPSIQNTRRFLAADATIGGQPMKSGDALLLVLACANRDPAVNAAPDVFDADRTERKVYTFGLGVHQCPGQLLAESIATAAVRVLLERALAFDAITAPIAYRPSANARIPELALSTS